MNPPASVPVTVPYRQLMGKFRVPAQAGCLHRFRRRFTGDSRAVPGIGQQVRRLFMACKQPSHRFYRS